MELMMALWPLRFWINLPCGRYHCLMLSGDAEAKVNLEGVGVMGCVAHVEEGERGEWSCRRHAERGGTSNVPAGRQSRHPVLLFGVQGESAHAFFVVCERGHGAASREVPQPHR